MVPRVVVVLAACLCHRAHQRLAVAACALVLAAVLAVAMAEARH